MSDAGTYSVTVRGRCLVAHSFRGECFGTAQNLHGITYTCDAEFIGSSLEEGTAFLIDIDLAHVLLEEALSAYDRTNLDDHADFRGENTTCERVARAVWERVAAGLRSRAHHYVDALKVLVRESDVAYVEYERALRGEASSGTYTVAVRGRCMCARSLPHGTSGQLALQGATFVVDALFSGRQLEQEKAFLIDICLAEEIVQAAVGRLHQQNLDDLPAYGRGRATSERVGERLWDEIAISLTNARHGREDGNAPPLDSLRVVVREHDLAAAEYAAPLGGGGGGGGGRFAVEAVGRCMLAHSFDGGGKVGGTFVLHARLYGGALAQEGCALIDRPVVEAALAEALAPYDRTDLDCAAEFDGEATTCERLSRAVWCRLSASLPPAAAARLTAIEVEVRESDVAGATFRRSLRPDARGGITLVLDIDDLGDLGDLGAPATPADGEIGEIAPTPTGIVHVTPLARLLAAIPYRLVAVSGGSARTAAERLRALGLERISWARVVTADAIAAASSVGLSESLPLSASGFWARLLATEPRPSLHPPSSWRLVNGAASVRAAACSAGVSAPLPAVGRGFAVDEALLAAVGCTRPQVRDAVAYLTSKREPDAEARSTAVVDELTRCVPFRLSIRTHLRAPHQPARLPASLVREGATPHGAARLPAQSSRPPRLCRRSMWPHSTHSLLLLLPGAHAGASVTCARRRRRPPARSSQSSTSGPARSPCCRSSRRPPTRPALQASRIRPSNRTSSSSPRPQRTFAPPADSPRRQERHPRRRVGCPTCFTAAAPAARCRPGSRCAPSMRARSPMVPHPRRHRPTSSSPARSPTCCRPTR